MIVGGGVITVVILLLIGFYMQEGQNKPKDKDAVLKLIYTFLIGIFVVLFVGVGIAAFYPEPKFPEAPTAIKYGSPESIKSGEQSEETKAEIEKFDKEEKEYQIQSRIYNRNVSIIALTASILIVIASPTLFKEILLIADGLLLGGVFTLLYSVGRGFGAEDNKFRFVVVTVGLIISLILGYVKFIQPTKKKALK